MLGTCPETQSNNNHFMCVNRRKRKRVVTMKQFHVAQKQVNDVGDSLSLLFEISFQDARIQDAISFQDAIFSSTNGPIHILLSLAVPSRLSFQTTKGGGG